MRLFFEILSAKHDPNNGSFLYQNKFSYFSSFLLLS